MDLFKPRGASAPRRPTDNNQQNGQIINTPRYATLGGLKNASAAGSKNHMSIKPPGELHPVYFIKPSTSVTGPYDPIEIPDIGVVGTEIEVPVGVVGNLFHRLAGVFSYDIAYRFLYPHYFSGGNFNIRFERRFSSAAVSTS
jgi:hypothetical protein